ncbi:MAG: Asp-tRNA(Asn)/Glu-tRNA(Gln) amidotransferase subunit GatB [Lachnospiraceae bacterium]|nr:Asp-tRNA(Asn)/Glu-tRNA(Gln) amidotransferase subunit GatB [Lachnospiraceae bacterium]
MKQYETVIGLEVHVELATKTKIFCGCKTDFGAKPNTHVCPVCTGMPGALPVLNRQVVELALRAGLALNCQIHQVCKFDRKNYFYPDNPQNYQISQLYLPICHDGYVEIPVGEGRKRIRIHEIHMEEDAGKLVHDEWSESSLVDYNRSGVPLIEIVSEPDMRTADEVIAYLEKLQTTMQYLGVSDCRLQEGSMRADVNLSVREIGNPNYGTRTEMKNLNSFKAIAHAIEGERERQTELLEEGRRVVQETRRWDENKEASHSMRSKEDARDYRYFPDPDLLPVCISDAWIARVRTKLPELKEEREARYQAQYGLSKYAAGLLTNDRALADMFEATIAAGAPPKKAANWLTGETLRLLKEREKEASEICFSAAHLAALIRLAEQGVIQSQTAKEVFAAVFADDADPEEYVRAHGLGIENDTFALEKAVQEILLANPKAAGELRDGKEKVMGFLIGQTMRALKGKASPERVKETIQRFVNG